MKKTNHTKKAPFSVLILVALLALSILNVIHLQPSVEAALTWNIRTVDSSFPSNRRIYSSLALDSFSTPHIAYGDLYAYGPGGVSYASWTGSTFSIENTGLGGWMPCLAFDDGNVPHISYEDSSALSLKLATKVGSSWPSETVDGTGDPRWSSLKIDTGNYPHITYVAGVGSVDVKYATRTDSAWSTEYVFTSSATGFERTSLALDSKGNPHASSFHTYWGNVYYSNKTGASWGSPVTVDSGLGPTSGDCSIAVDSFDRPCIAYLDENAYGGTLKFARWTGTTWSIQTVDSPRFIDDFVGERPSLFLDYMDRPYISYYDYWIVGGTTNYWALKFARWTGTAWSTEFVDGNSLGVGEVSSLAVSPAGVVHISYCDYLSGDLKYATTTIPNFDSDEYFFQYWLDPLDSDGDGKNDAIKATIDVDSSYIGTQKVIVLGFLRNSSNNNVAYNYSTWAITDAAYDYGEITLFVPAEASEGWYDVILMIYDNGSHFEDQIIAEDYAYLYPPIPKYSATIWSWDALDPNGWISVPITMDGSPTGFSTGHTFSGLTGTHTFTVPNVDLNGHAFSSWNTGETSTTITVTSGGTYTAQYGTHMYLAVRGSNNGIYYRSYDTPAASWSSWSSLPGSTSDSPAAAVVGNELHLVVRGANAGQIWHGYVNLNDNTFSGWTPLSGSTPSAPTLTANTTHLCLVVRGDNNAIYYRFYEKATRTWSGWAGVIGGATVDTPAARLIGNALFVVVRGANNDQIWHGFVNLAANTFSGWTLLSGATPSQPTLTGNSTSLCLVVQGNNNAIYYRWYNLGSETWTDWTGFQYGATPDAPAASIKGDNLQIVVRGLNGNQIWHGTLNLSTDVWSGWTSLDGTTPSKPVLTS